MLIVNISWVIDSNPLGDTITFGSCSEEPFRVISITAPDLNSIPVNGLTTTRSGIVV